MCLYTVASTAARGRLLDLVSHHEPRHGIHVALWIVDKQVIVSCIGDDELFLFMDAAVAEEDFTITDRYDYVTAAAYQERRHCHFSNLLSVAEPITAVVRVGKDG